MKIAIVHDWLNQKVGGAENVLIELTKMYPTANVYTLVYNPHNFDKYLNKKRIITSRLQAYPAFMRNRPFLLLPFIQKAVRSWDFGEYDIIISSSTAWVKNINNPGGVRHICYCHSPARMLWDSWPKYLRGFKLGPVRKYYINRLASKLRLWDYYQSQQNIEFIANSKFVEKRIDKFYHQPSKVIYPPVGINSATSKHTHKKEDYYLVLSVVAPYKNIELAVRAFMDSGKRLIVAGEGEDLNRLRTIASGADNIEFRGRVNEDQKQHLLDHARGFVFCSIEDFGITMVEAIAANTPVIALKGGGASEIVRPGVTGVFYNEPTETALNKAITLFEKEFSGDKKLQNAYIFEKYSKSVFGEKIKREVAR